MLQNVIEINVFAHCMPTLPTFHWWHNQQYYFFKLLVDCDYNIATSMEVNWIINLCIYAPTSNDALKFAYSSILPFRKGLSKYETV